MLFISILKTNISLTLHGVQSFIWDISGSTIKGLRPYPINAESAKRCAYGHAHFHNIRNIHTCKLLTPCRHNLTCLLSCHNVIFNGINWTRYFFQNLNFGQMLKERTSQYICFKSIYQFPRIFSNFCFSFKMYFSI